MLQVAQFVFNDFQENTYIVWDETLECVIVDPGCYKVSEEKQLTGFITDKQLKPVKVLNTHCHIDHILGNRFVCESYNIPLYLHKGELETYNQAAKWAAMLGLALEQITAPENLVFIDENSKIEFGNTVLSIAFTPGHSVASVTFYNVEQQIALVGDVLFYESIGRTDLPGGNFETLIQSIKNKLFAWPDTMKVLSGHGPQTTVGHERKHNPFLV